MNHDFFTTWQSGFLGRCGWFLSIFVVFRSIKKKLLGQIFEFWFQNFFIGIVLQTKFEKPCKMTKNQQKSIKTQYFGSILVILQGFSNSVCRTILIKKL